MAKGRFHRRGDYDMCGGSPLFYKTTLFMILGVLILVVGEISQERRFIILLSFSPLFVFC